MSNNNKSSHRESSSHNQEPDAVEKTEITGQSDSDQISNENFNDDIIDDIIDLPDGSTAIDSADLVTETTDQKNYNELTRINLIFLEQHSENGFKRAQNDVNEELSKKEILLNNRFVLDSVLGSGGMGTVYKAKDLRKVEAQDSNPYVAVKVLNTDFKKHPSAFISLQREASRSHLLSHPNIVTVHDFDRHGDTIYMTMELLRGEALDSYLHRHRNKSISKDMALKIVGQFCRALEYAHQKGIVHCDLKPANIFISDHGVKVLDFGIARLANESKLTDQFDAGTLGAMTPAYASLEMMQKKTPEASDDVYAAAIITYKLLTGKHPYDEQPAAAALGLKMTPAKVDGLTSRQWKALHQALALKREERTASIQEFYRGLTESVRVPFFRIASAVLFAVVGWFGYVKYFVPDELTLFVEKTKENIARCYQNKDYVCTISGANSILKVAPNDAEAKALLNKANNDLKQDEIIGQLELARNYLSQKNYEDAERAIEKVLHLDLHNAKALSIQKQIGVEKTAQQAEVEKAAQEYTLLLSKANQCLEKTEYQCAIKFAKQALLIRNNDAEADAIVRSATYAEQKQQENFRKAEKILEDGKACFERLNYSCAIAKSESALEFVPGHKRAISLKLASEKAISDAKKNISIE